MTWSDLSLAKKLIIPIAVITALLAALSAVQISALNSITTDYSHVNERYLPALQLVLNADRDLYQAQIAERSIALGMPEPVYLTMHKENLEQVETRLRKVLALDISSQAKTLASEFLQAFSQWRPKTEQLVQQVNDGVISMAASSQISATTLEKEFEAIRGILDQLGESVGKEAGVLQKSAQDEKNSAMNTILILVVIALIVAVLVIVYFPRLITGPVNQLSRVLGQMAEGKGDLTIRMPDVGNDEIGVMSRNFNRFITGMQQMIGNIQAVAQEVSSAGQNLQTSSADSQKISTDYSHLMEQVATANHQMGLAIQEVSSNTQQVSEEAKTADSSARDVAAQFRQAMTEIQSLADNINQSGDVIQELVAETTNIASVLDVIKGIAEQTNLLALNAAIEAARAGEQGRGFAVVADEVRTLASKTQQSTGDINVMIEKLRSGVTRAVSSMEESQERAVRTVDYANQSETNIQSVSAAMVSISDRILQVASAIEEQTSVINEINHNLTSAKDLSSAGTASTNTIAQAVKGLNQQSENLRAEVSSFSL